jgi:hypothetical protein
MLVFTYLFVDGGGRVSTVAVRRLCYGARHERTTHTGVHCGNGTKNEKKKKSINFHWTSAGPRAWSRYTEVLVLLLLGDGGGGGGGGVFIFVSRRPRLRKRQTVRYILKTYTRIRVFMLYRWGAINVYTRICARKVFDCNCCGYRSTVVSGDRRHDENARVEHISYFFSFPNACSHQVDTATTTTKTLRGKRRDNECRTKREKLGSRSGEATGARASRDGRKGHARIRLTVRTTANRMWRRRRRRRQRSL